MFSGARYKRSQGRFWRQVTFYAMVATAAIGAWRLSQMAGVWTAAWLTGDNSWVAQYALPLAVFGLGAWASFRVVNYPPFAEFLISVEGEMNKVSWPSRGELYRASMVVIVMIFLLVAILFAYDLILQFLIGGLLGG
ncbi:MAG: preprotein translocase subunit SecE [Planctomycetaceae bacterium]|nr:preprotein translocase subunit SecE [Planctomycetaceae bacterium]